MAGRIEAKLAEMGVTLPKAPASAANYVPIAEAGGLVWISGQVSAGPKGPVRGKLGATMTTEEGQAAARLCALSLLAQAKAAAGGDLDRVARIVKLTVFVNSAPDFTEQHLVANGASNFLGEALGEAGKHTRSAMGASSLPLGVAVEIEGVVALK